MLAKETGQTDLQNNAAGRLAAARGRLDDFLQQTGRHKQQLRETVPGFGRSEASSAVWAARRQGHVSDASLKPITKITEQAIAALPVVRCPSMSDAEMQSIHAGAQELLRVAKDQNNGYEVCFVYRNDWSDPVITKGTSSGANFVTARMGQNLTLLHNHPRNGPFSIADLYEFVKRPEILNFARICNNGEIQIIRRAATCSSMKLSTWYARFARDCSCPKEPS